MTGYSDYSATASLNWLGGAKAMPSLPQVWLGLFTTAPTDAGGGTEVSGGSYARVQIAGVAATNGTTANGNNTLHFAATPSWIVTGMSIYDVTGSTLIPAATTVVSTTGTTVVMSANAAGAGVGNGDSIAFSAFAAPSGSAPVTEVNTLVTITFPQASASWGTATSFGLFDAVTTGNLLFWDYLGNFSWLPATVSSASPGVLTAKAHGYSAADSVVFTNEYGGTSPSFSQSNFTGILAVVSPAADTFTVTNAATAVNTSTTGSGMVRKIIQQSIPINVTASFGTATLTLSVA